MHSFAEGTPEADRLLPIAHEPARDARDARTSSAARCARRRYLEGDFVLRSGRRSKYYLDKYRFETRPDLLGPLGAAIAAAVREHEPEAVAARRARSSARSRSPPPRRSQSGLPFLIVRKEAKDYGTVEPARGRLREGGAASASSRTSSPPAERRSRRSKRCARRASGSRTRSASSTARRAASTRSRAMPCGSGRSSRPPSSSKDTRKSAWLSDIRRPLLAVSPKV